MKQNNSSLIQQLLGAIYLIKKGRRTQGLEVLEKLVKTLQITI